MSKLAPVVRVNYVVVGLDKVLGHHLDKRPTVVLWRDSDSHRPYIYYVVQYFIARSDKRASAEVLRSLHSN